MGFSSKTIISFQGLSVTSCLIRNDYNVLFAFLILIILNKYYVENTKLYTKIIVHILVALVIADIFWLIVIMPYWNSNVKNDYWNKLSGLRSFVLFIAFIQLLLKVLQLLIIRQEWLDTLFSTTSRRILMILVLIYLNIQWN